MGAHGMHNGNSGGTPRETSEKFYGTRWDAMGSRRISRELLGLPSVYRRFPLDVSLFPWETHGFHRKSHGLPWVPTGIPVLPREIPQ